MTAREEAEKRFPYPENERLPNGSIHPDFKAMIDGRREDFIAGADWEFAREEKSVPRSLLQPQPNRSEFLTGDSAWPLRSVLYYLTIGCEYLLHKKDYDGADYEEIERCVRLGKTAIKNLSTAQPQPVSDAVAFTEWIVEKEWQRVFYRKEEYKWCSYAVSNFGGNEGDYYSTAELYQLFKSETGGESSPRFTEEQVREAMGYIGSFALSIVKDKDIYGHAKAINQAIAGYLQSLNPKKEQ